MQVWVLFIFVFLLEIMQSSPDGLIIVFTTRDDS
jgi:hypothetical protein